MRPSVPPHPYTPQRVPAASIRHAVWRYCRVCRSSREVEELLCARGLLVTYAALRQGGHTCGQAAATERRHRRPRPGDTWPLDAVCLTSTGAQPSLWRAVEQAGDVLASLGQSRRNKPAAQKFFRQRLQRLQYVPRVISTDQRKSSGAAKRESLPRVEPRQPRSLHKRAANWHPPPRPRERRRQHCKSPGQAQGFLSADGPIAQPCRPRRHRLSASAYRQAMRHRCARWAELTGTERAA